MRIKTFLILLLLLPALTFAAQKDKEVHVVSVYDGDTFRVDIWYWPEIIGKNMPIRVNGIDTPEIRARCGTEKLRAFQAKEFTRKFLKSGSVQLRNLKRGKYFRIIADVYVDGRNLGDELIKAGLARVYDGGTKKTWCGQ